MDWLPKLSKSVLYAGTIILILSILASGQMAAGASIAGYSCVGLALLLFLVHTQENGVDINKLLLIYSPLWAMVFIISFVLFLTIRYYNIIREERVSNSYYTFSNLVIILFLAQLFILKKQDYVIPDFNLSALGVLFIALLQLIICLLILYVILAYYTTDG